MSLLTLPVDSERDELLVKVVATFLANHGVDPGLSGPLALQALAALERYNQGGSIEACARQLEIPVSTLELYRANSKE
jgi:hypothetical protein